MDKRVLGGFMTELENQANAMEISAQQYGEALQLIENPGDANDIEIISRVLLAGQSMVNSDTAAEAASRMQVSAHP